MSAVKIVGRLLSERLVDGGDEILSSFDGRLLENTDDGLLGVLDGCPEGWLDADDGMIDLVTIGFTDGSLDGLVDALSIGSKEGRREGSKEGGAVGSLTGDFVGENVG